MPSRYDPARHHRRSIRLRGYDYVNPGAYFVTMVTRDRDCLFDNAVFRRVVEYNWQQIARHFENVVLDEWVVMPNHIHGIIIITDSSSRRGEALSTSCSNSKSGWLNANRTFLKSGRDNASPLQTRELARGVSPGALGAIIGNFKSVTARRINHIRRSEGATIWQRNYYEHIARNERDLARIQEYVIGILKPHRSAVGSSARRGAGGGKPPQDGWGQKPHPPLSRRAKQAEFIGNPARWESDRENPKARIANDMLLAEESIWFSKSNLRLPCE